MEPICIGEYVLKPSIIEMYRVEQMMVGGLPEYLISLYLKNGSVIRETIKGEDELEEITDNLYNALKEKE